MMFKKKYVIGLLISLIVMLAAAGVSLLGPMDFLGLDFTDSFIIKADIKEEFDEETIYGVLSSYKSRTGDTRVEKAGDHLDQAVIRVQHGNEELAKEIVGKIAEKYENAAYRGFVSERNYSGMSPLLRYSLIVLLAVLAVCVFLAVRQGVAFAAGTFFAILFGEAAGVCLTVLVAVPIGVGSYMGSVLSAFLSAAVLLTLIGGKMKEEAHKGDEKPEEPLFSPVMKGVAVKGGIAAAAALVFLALLIIFGGTQVKAFAVSLAAGGITGVFSAYMIGAPLIWEIMEKGKTARLKPRKRAKAIR